MHSHDEPTDSVDDVQKNYYGKYFLYYNKLKIYLTAKNNNN